MAVKPSRGHHKKATWRGLAGQREERGRERSIWLPSTPLLPRHPTAPPHLGAVAVGSNQVVGGDVQVLAGTRKQAESGVSVFLPD